MNWKILLLFAMLVVFYNLQASDFNGLSSNEYHAGKFSKNLNAQCLQVELIREMSVNTALE